MSRLKKAKRIASRSIIPLWEADLSDYVIDLVWSPTGDYVVGAAISGEIWLWEAATGRLIQKYQGHNFGTSALAWQPHHDKFASAGQDGKIRLWSTQNERSVGEFDGGGSWVEQLVWHPDGQYLATAAGRCLRLWNHAGGLIQDYPAHNSTISDLAWQPYTTQLTSSSYSTLRFFDPTQTNAIREFSWKGSILTLAWSPDGRFIATGDQDATVHFWFADSAEELQMWGYQTKVRELSWDHSSRFLATGGGTDIVIWDCQTSPAGTTPLMLQGHQALLSTLAYQHQGDYLASGDDAGVVMLWQPNHQAKPLAKKNFKSGITKICWSPNDQQIALGTSDGRIVIMQPLK